VGVRVSRMWPLRGARSRLAAPLRRYFDPQFAHLNQRLDELVQTDAAAATADRARALARIDVSGHNAGRTPPTFDEVVSQAVSAAQFADPSFERLRRVMFPGAVTIPWGATHASVTVPHRKLWEFVYVLRAAEQHGKLEPGLRAVGFGVGQEPIPAVLARFGLSVLATDLDAGTDVSAGWAAAGQHMTGLEALSRPDVVPDEVLQQHVSTRYVDMSDVPDDLGRFDLVWSSCALEHLGPPAAAGLAFVMRSLDLLEPGGVAVHTTELELTPRAETEYVEGTAIYRVDDLDRLAAKVRDEGFEMQTNWYVSMDSPADRWISMPPHPQDDPAHLKLAVGDSVSTSVGLLIRRPA
jgi:SAM-dependent methyltransferase